MPKVSINIIKDWFKNQMKPPQEQFWAWLDSFWHKDEPIPQDAVENLVTTLQKKADLVNGMVPEHQLPFSVVTSEVIALGKREITGNVLKLNVHSSGANVVRVKGKLITRSFENTWTFSEITGSGINVLRGYAVKSEDDFFMVESGEQAEITDPEIPADALEIFKLALSAAGIVQDPDAENGYKLRDEDPWRTVQILNAAPMNIVTATSPSTSFNIEVFTLAPKIAAIKTKVKKNTRDGLEITLYNNSDIPVSLMAGDYVEDLTFSSFPFADNYTLKPRSFAKFKRKENKYHELAGGGSASFPEGTNGQVLELDSTAPDGVKWVDKIKGVAASFLHYWNGSTWLSSGVEFISAGIIKVKSIILTTNSGPALPNELGYDGTNVFFGNAKRKLAFVNEIKTISGNVTLDESYNGCICQITATCTITVPVGLSQNFGCAFDANGSVIATFVEEAGGIITFSAPKGKLLTNDNTCSLVKIGANRFRLNGGLIPL